MEQWTSELVLSPDQLCDSDSAYLHVLVYTSMMPVRCYGEKLIIH
jgi:hypothetical protein